MFRTVFLKINWFCIILLFLSCVGKEKKEQLPYYNTSEFTPLFLTSSVDVQRDISHTIQPFSFTNQMGNTITEKDVDGKIHVANFIFTRCGLICPILTKHMKMVQDAFQHNADLIILSYSVTPWLDSVSVLKKYAEKNEIVSQNWHLLTGSQSEIYKLARQSYFAEEDLGFTKDSTEFLHTEHVLLVDKTRRIRGIYNGTLQLDMEQLIADIRQLHQEF